MPRLTKAQRADLAAGFTASTGIPIEAAPAKARPGRPRKPRPDNATAELKLELERASRHNDHLAKEVMRVTNELGQAKAQIAQQLEYIGKADQAVANQRDNYMRARTEAEVMRRLAYPKAPRFPWERP